MSDKLRAAAQMALEALDWFISKEMTVGQRYTNEGQQALDSFIALREALAEQPVAREPMEADVSAVNGINARIHFRRGWRAAEVAHGIGTEKGDNHA